MKTPHRLKTWPEYFQQVWASNKLFEVRKNDRDFQVGDRVDLVEYEPESEKLTGREISAVITYVLHGGLFGIEKGHVAFGLLVLSHLNLSEPLKVS